MKELIFIINGYKNTDFQKNLKFIEILKNYDNIIYLCKKFMELYSHCLSNKIYNICFLIHTTYDLWGKYYENTGNIKIKNDLIKTITLKLKGKYQDDDIKTYKKLVNNLLGKCTLTDIKKELDNINDNLLLEIANELFEESFEEIKDYCHNITKEEIIIKSERMFEYEDIGGFITSILDEQIKINNEPDISKKDFFEKYPNFEKSLDKHGLISLGFENFELLKNYNHDGIYYKDFFIYFDDLFQNGDKRLFLDNFFYLAEQKRGNTTYKIKLNYNKIISLKKYKYVMLIEGVYFGPEYDSNKFFITEKKKPPELTVKIRESEQFNECFGNNLERTEFKFDPKNNSFLIEEIGENIYNGFYNNRLAHCEFNVLNKTIKHFDGSILLYDENGYYKRKEINLLRQEKLEHNKIKLFQIDGEISIKEREELLLSYYDGNELILEYLDKNSYKNNFKNILKKQ